DGDGIYPDRTQLVERQAPRREMQSGHRYWRTRLRNRPHAHAAIVPETPLCRAASSVARLLAANGPEGFSASQRALHRRGQPLATALIIRPGILLLGDALGHGGDGERGGWDLRGELVPGERRGDRRSGSRAQRVRRDRGRAARIAQVVNEDFAAAACLAHRRGE